MKRRRAIEASFFGSESRRGNDETLSCFQNRIEHVSRIPRSSGRRSGLECRFSFVLFCVMACFTTQVLGFNPVERSTGRPRQRTFRLFVIEPTERTGEMYTTIATDAVACVDHDDVLESLGMHAQATTTEGAQQPIEACIGESSMQTYEDDERRSERLVKVAKAATLLARRDPSARTERMAAKNTSVGSRRTRTSSYSNGSFSRLTDAISKAASSNTSKPDKEKSGDGVPSMSIALSDIQATVESMMQSSMGLFGEPETRRAPVDYVNPQQQQQQQQQQIPPPGTILVSAEPSNKIWKASERVSVRMALMADDLDVANLRLSVFSDFSPDMRRAFCAKSCQVLSTRRNRGAMCIVATVPRYGSIMLPRPDIILGTVECSFHEFEGTVLGRRRRMDSILYITEVAVSPTARRKGIGHKLMESIDELAKIRGVETLFLHVDTTNYAALSLYQRAGYSLVPHAEPMYEEFTRSLNLHDGATRGRNHYLLMKNLLQPTWLPDYEFEIQTGTLGFDITAS